MINFNDIKYDWNDISIVPAKISEIDSRSSVSIFHENNKLPLFVAPMDTVINTDNVNIFIENDLNICMPRGIVYDETHSFKNDVFYSYGLSEIEDIINSNGDLPPYVLIDIANGHMSKLLSISLEIKTKYKNTKLMIGNIANPETYQYILTNNIADYVRVGIGGGNVCTTSANTGVHYPMASLVKECRKIANYHREVYARMNVEYKHVNIVADGGFRNFSDIIKAIGIGADYVMIGSTFNKCIESCSIKYDEHGSQLDNNEAITMFNNGDKIYSLYRGMSTKEVQRKWKKNNLKTSEGISKKNIVEYTLSSWIENFSDYLKSAMSYSGAISLAKFIAEAKFIMMTVNSFHRFNK